MQKILPLLLVSCAAASAQPAPRINSLSQEWLQRGSETEVRISGEHLGEILSILVNGDPGVAASLSTPKGAAQQVEAAAGGISTLFPADPNSIAVRLQISDKASLTDREIRIATKAGVSNPLPLRISELPEIQSNPSNNSPEHAQEITLPAIVNGAISALGETDHYKFNATPGQTILVEVMAYRMGSQLDSSVAILDATGKELVRNEDAVGLDSVITFDPPAAGNYTIAIRDFRYMGGGDFKYRLKAGSLPFVTSYFPLGAKRGEQVDIQLQGTNLDNLSTMKIQVASDAPVGAQQLRASNNRGLSNPFLFEINDQSNFTEQEPNSSIDQADLVSFPGSINGRIHKEKDWDAYRFTAQKGQQLTFELQAQKFGSPLDAFLTLTDWRGNHLARNDDANASDARIEFTFTEDGQYHLIVEDLLGRGGDFYTYRLTGSTSLPSFSASFMQDTPRIHRGGRVPVRVEVARLNGFVDTLKIEAENLPSGIFAEPLILSSSQPSAGNLILIAREDAALGFSQLKLRVTGLINGKIVSMPAEALFNDKPSKSAYLTVLEPSPFALSSTTLMATAEQNQPANFDLHIDRRGGFTGEVVVTAEGFSAGRDPISKSFDLQPVTIKSGESTGSLQLRAKQDSEIGTRHIILKGETTREGVKLVEYSAPIPITTSEIPFVLSTSQRKVTVTAIPAGSPSAAAEAFFTVKAQRRAGFNGEIELLVEGVPEGITLTADKIPANGAETTVKLLATEKATAAKDFELKLTGRGVHNDKNYRFAPGSVTLTVNAPEPGEAKLAEKK